VVDNQPLSVTAFGYTSAVGTVIMDQVAVLGEQVCLVPDLVILRLIEAYTGYTEGFSGAENCKENAMKTTNSITKFSALKSVIKLKLFCI